MAKKINAVTNSPARRRIAALLGVLLVGSSASARTIVVDPDGGDVATLAEAIDAAKAGDTVFVRRFSDRIRYGHELNLKEGVSYVSDGNAGARLSIKNTRNVTLRGFWFNGLNISESHSVRLEQCRFTDLSEVADSEGITISSSAFVAARLVIRNSRGVTIQGSAFAKSLGQTGTAYDTDPKQSWAVSESYGPYLEVDGSDVVIQGNTFAGNDYFLAEKRPSGTWKEANESVVKDGVGLLVQCATRRERNSRRERKPRRADPGATGHHCEVADNIFASNGRGMLLADCAADDAKVRGNVFFANRLANYASLTEEQTGSEERLVVGELLPSGTDRGGNIVEDPGFSDPQKTDYSLRPASPAAHMAAGEAAGASAAALSLVQEKPEKASPQYCDQTEPDVVFSTNADTQVLRDRSRRVELIDSEGYFSMTFKMPIECCRNGQFNGAYIGDLGRFTKSFLEKIEGQRLRGGATIAGLLRDDPDRRKRWARPDGHVFRGLRELRSPTVREEQQSARCSLVYTADLGARGLEGFFGRTLEGDWGEKPDVRITTKGLVGRLPALAAGAVIKIENESEGVTLAVEHAANVIGDDPAHWYWKELAKNWDLKQGEWTAFRLLLPGHYRLTARQILLPPSSALMMIVNVE